MDHEPTVWPIEWGELLEFCNSAGYRCRLEPSGSLLIPPDYNVGMTDWEKSLRLRKGEFSVLGAEPAPGAPAGVPDYPPSAATFHAGGRFIDGPSWGWGACRRGGGGGRVAAARYACCRPPLLGPLPAPPLPCAAPCSPAHLRPCLPPCPAPADDEELHVEQLSAHLDSILCRPEALAAARASLERLLPREGGEE